MTTVAGTPHSATLAINDVVAARRAAGRSVLHLGFGEAGLPVLDELTEVLAGAAWDNRYGPSNGSSAARDAAADWFTRRGLATGADQIIVSPGSKPLLLAFLTCIDGDVVLPKPAWVTYAAQAALLGRGVISVPIPSSAGGVPDPDLLDAALTAASARGARPGVLILTVPDNPTGTVPSDPLLQRVCTVAERHGLAIICDEIYASLCHEGAAPSAAAYLPERTVITTGLSKSLALGGWRIGYARTPDNTWGHDLMRAVTGVASEMWSSLAAPMQAVMTHVLGDPPEVVAFIQAARTLHARIATAVHARLIDAGAACRPPQAGFYLYPDFGQARRELAAQGIDTGTGLAQMLLDEYDIATLPGVAFGDDEEALTLRVATSLLYGTTIDERRSALSDDMPEKLPWIADPLTRLGDCLVRTTGRAPRTPGVRTPTAPE